MAPLLKQQNKITSAGTGTNSDGYIISRTIAPTSALANGSLLFLVINMSGTNATIASVTDSAGYTWTKWAEASINSAKSGTDQATEIWTTFATSAATPTITMTATAAVSWAVNIREYTGVQQAGFKLTAGVAGDVDYGLAHAVSAAAPAGNGDLVITGINVSRANEIFSVGGGYTNLTTMGAATGLPYLSAAVQDRVTSAAGVPSASFGTSQYDRGAMWIVALKALVTSAPNPPTDLNITSGNAAAAMSWAASPGADSYTVRMSTSPTGTFTVVQSGISGTSYTKTALTNGTKYYFQVSAVNSVGESARTSFAVVTPAPPPPVVFSDWYANGTKPNLNATSMRQTFRSKVDSWFSFVLTSENNPGTPIPANSRFPGPVKRIKAPEQGFYPDSNSRNGTVSEGQAYGALFCAWLSNPSLPSGVYWPEARATLDALYRYYDFHKNERGLMNWHIYVNGTEGDFNGATDGDQDMAEALRVASELHGDDGAINYGAEANKLMKAIEDWEFVPETGYAYPNLMTNGDGWGFNADTYMPDYSRMGYWREWATWLRKRGYTARADRWLRILQANYDFIQYYVDSTSYVAGVPDRQTRTHGTIDGDFNNQITYNSVRLGFGWMTDYLWHGADADPRALQFMNKISNKAKATFVTGGNVKAPNYSPNLSTFQGYSNLTGFGYVGSTSLGNSANQTFATEIFNALAASTEYSTSYFNGGIGCYALGLMSGAAQPFTTAAATTVVTDPSTGTTTTVPVPVDVNPTAKAAVFEYFDGTSWIQLTPTSTVA